MEKSDWDYRGLTADTYDLWFGEEPYWDQTFFQQRLTQNGGTGLELGCGTGRLLIPFLREGLSVEGVDASEEMLAICKTKAVQAGVTPVLYQGWMQELALDQRYQTLYIPAGSFQILAEREEAVTALERFHAHLEPGGELLVTLFVPGQSFKTGKEWSLRRSGVRPTDGATILIHQATQSDRLEQVQDIWLRYEVYKEESLMETILRTHQMRWYHKHEFGLMLEKVGFREISMQSGYNPSQVGDPEAEMIFSARR